MRLTRFGRILGGLCVLAAPFVSASTAAAVPLIDPTATFCQTNYLISEAVDGNTADTLNNGWAIFPNVGQNFTAVFKLDNGDELGEAAGVQLTFQFNMLYPDTHSLGKFRLSATTSNRSTFGQGSMCTDANPGGTATWTVLMPDSLSSLNGQTLTVQPDGSILASGANPLTDIVTFQVTSALRRITGFRLEALSDASFPSGGPGRASNGNFVLTELVLEADERVGAPALGSWAMAFMALLLAGAGMFWRRQRAA